MREYLFRGKSLDTGEWVYGSLIDLDKESGYLYIMRPHLGASTLPPFSLVRLHSELVDPETVGQWTGLVDKNGVKIFEGDVLESPVKRLGYKHGNLIIITDIRECKFIALYANSYEIIGNVRDNPELIEIGGINER